MKLSPIKPDQITALVDTREQHPLQLSPMLTKTATLATGDYSAVGLEKEIAIERKSLPDLLGCVGRDRQRFEREIDRLLAYPVRAIVVEASWADLESGEWRGKVTPQAALGSVLGWLARGVPIIMAGDRHRAANYISRLIWITAKRRWEQLRKMQKAQITKNV